MHNLDLPRWPAWGHRPPLRHVLAIAVTALAVGSAGCGGSGPADSSADTGGIDAAPDAAQDTDGTGEGDASDGDLADGDTWDVPDVPPGPAEPPDFEAGPARALTDLVPMGERTAWLVGAVDPDIGDRTYGDLERGAFRFPLPGGGLHGIRWEPAEFDEEGRVTNAGNTAEVYMVGTFTLDEGERGLILQSERTVRAWVDGRRRPADIYSGNNIRVAWPLDTGEHELVIRYQLNRGGQPRPWLWTTTDPIVLNTADVTSPQLVAGASDTQWLGVAVVVTGDVPLSPVRTRVVASEFVEETTFLTPGVAPGATTQLPFELRPTSAWPDEGPVPVTVRVEAPQLEASYELAFDVPVVAAGERYRRTRLSATDHSVQYAAIVPPTGAEPDDGWGIVLALHGAAVRAEGHAGSYAPKEWAAIVAPTNRRPFGFDWEVFGRRDALEALADAKDHFRHDPTRVHVTGHSMGGHGTWQLGTLFPTLFATVGPSAGWDSFYSYGGESRPRGVFARSQASSVSSNYAPTNLARRAVYVIHGEADDNVPVREARDMVALLEPAVEDLQFHEQPGAGHWWNVDPEPGADCVDWGPLWETMEQRRLDPLELDFTFRSPSPWVSATHSFVTIEAADSPMEDVEITSAYRDEVLTVESDNVRQMRLDGDALDALGVDRVWVDGEGFATGAGPITVGAAAAKRVGLAGPFNAVLERPFCLVYEEAGPPVYAELAAYWSADWSSIGNGHACTVTLEGLTRWVEENYQLVFMGVPPQFIDFDGPVEFELAGTALHMDGHRWDNVALVAAYPYADHLAGLVITTDGREDLAFRYSPFQSRLVLPDFLVFGDSGGRATGYFDDGWHLSPSFSEGL